MPMRVPDDELRRSPAARAARSRSARRRARCALRSSSIAERLRELARARAEVDVARDAAARSRISSMPSSGSSARISTAAPTSSRLAHGVQQRVDAVGAVHVGDARRPEQRRGARRQPDVGVAGGLAVVVGLGLDDHARRRRRGATVQPTRSRATSSDRALVEAARTPSPARAAQALPRAARARARATVPPSRHLGLQPRALREHRERPSSPSSPARAARSASSDSAARVDRVADEPGDDPVGLAERHAALDQQVGEVGRGDQLVGRRGRHRARGRSARRRSCPSRPRATARACRRRRRGAPCPPAGPCCRSAAGRA